VLKFAVAFAPLTVMAWLGGMKVNPALVGVTVYGPFAIPEKVRRRYHHRHPQLQGRWMNSRYYKDKSPGQH
jgi:hypothetical protein